MESVQSEKSTAEKTLPAAAQVEIENPSQITDRKPCLANFSRLGFGSRIKARCRGWINGRSRFVTARAPCLQTQMRPSMCALALVRPRSLQRRRSSLLVMRLACLDSHTVALAHLFSFPSDGTQTRAGHGKYGKRDGWKKKHVDGFARENCVINYEERWARESRYTRQRRVM